jgi:hypothetical protein
LKRESNNIKYKTLRKRFPVFEYQSYSININKQNLNFSFSFKMGDKIRFNPSYNLPVKDFYFIESIPVELLNNLVFNIGLIELISYWKAACPPKVIIKPHKLAKEQVDFWKKLYFNGLGEFFYLNDIETNINDFMEIESGSDLLKPVNIKTKKEKVIVPVGGGKDSVVTLELLNENGFNIIPMAINPRDAVKRTINIAGFSIKESIVVNRKLDKKLLELNDQGFLNGHTPFSALLAFVSSLTAFLSGVKYIALSNENSANESTVPDSDINHQYSKSFEFEQDFNDYFYKYISHDILYFSFLRPINELQIGALFSRFDKHHFSFRSCNAGSKRDEWCGKCPKCLFTRIILGPFIDNGKMKRIFGKELFDDLSLMGYFNELTGESEIKPFECVGTVDEVNSALSYLKRHWKGELPVLLKHYNDKSGNSNIKYLLNEFNIENKLPEKFEQILKNELVKEFDNEETY